MFESQLPKTYDHEQTFESGKQLMYDGEPKTWGSHFWNYVHLLAYYYPEEPDESVQKAAFHSVDAWRYLLPCHNCRDGFRAIIKEYPIEKYLNNRTEFLQWTILAHNAVNKKVGAPELDFQLYMNKLIGENAVVEDETAEEKQENKAEVKRPVAKSRDPKQINRLSDRSKHARAMKERRERNAAARVRAQFQARHNKQRSSLASARLSRVSNNVNKPASRSSYNVPPPKDCPNCNRRDPIPSIF